MSNKQIGYQSVIFEDSNEAKKIAIAMRKKNGKCIICNTNLRLAYWTCDDKGWSMFDGCNFCRKYIHKARDNYGIRYPAKIWECKKKQRK